MTTKLKNNTEIKDGFNHLFEQLTEKEILDNEAKIIMFRFLTIIEAKREELGWSRKVLAEKIGTSPSYISQLFRGDKLINMNTLANIQKVMDIQFEISQKKTYEVKIASKTTEFDAKGIWIYKPFDTPENSNHENGPTKNQQHRNKQHTAQRFELKDDTLRRK
jgi:transcriptional regulator with XRE-family HTH domain